MGPGTAGKDAKRSNGKKRKEVFVYGNYRYYYGYRLDRDSKEDPRLLAFKKEWFDGKDCLDIGCNEGLITISIARNFSCQSILGIDIDAALVDTARWNLRKVARNDACSRKSMEVISDIANEGSTQKLSTFQCSIEKQVIDSKCNSSAGVACLLDRVSFEKQNFIDNVHDCSKKYDTIICLSVTKWIHLNWGDEGLINLFVKIWRLLREGGILLLEPQPWKSYTKNRRVSETAKQNFSEILITPDIFVEILLDKVGFKSVENVTENIPRTVAGFERPIFAFKK